ncbi:hypothetical protein GBAR_LOCUS903, partial [Geodia barretti]
MDVWCHELLLESFQPLFMSKLQEFLQPQFSLAKYDCLLKRWSVALLLLQLLPSLPLLILHSPEFLLIYFVLNFTHHYRTFHMYLVPLPVIPSLVSF